jgi:hypothetical protein
MSSPEEALEETGVYAWSAAGGIGQGAGGKCDVLNIRVKERLGCMVICGEFRIKVCPGPQSISVASTMVRCSGSVTSAAGDSRSLSNPNRRKPVSIPVIPAGENTGTLKV